MPGHFEQALALKLAFEMGLELLKFFPGR